MISGPTSLAADLTSLHNETGKHLQRFLDDEVAGLQNVLTLESDLATWLEVLRQSPEVAQYRSAHRDLGLSFYAVSSGLYRQAFGALRSFVEVAFGALHLSSFEFERRKWISGRRDLSWAEIVSTETGLYSAAYLAEFMPTAAGERDIFLGKVASAYRRCSEYLHGNVATSELLPSNIQYVPEVVLEWCDVAEKSLVSFHHSMFVRYYNDIDHGDRQRVEALLEQHLGELLSVRVALGLPVERGLT